MAQEEVFLRRFSRWQADQQREAIADLYVAAYREPPAQDPPEQPPRRRDFLNRFADEVQRPGFDMLVVGETYLTGCIYGYPVPRDDGGWWQALRGVVAEDVGELIASGRVFVVAELMVLPSRRRKHIAARLHERLLTRVDTNLLATLVPPENAPARAALGSWGWAPTTADIPDLEVWTREPKR